MPNNFAKFRWSQVVTAVLSGMLLAGSGCGASDGDVAFYWNFDGFIDCDEARVTDVDVALVNGNGRVVRANTFACTGDGLSIYDVPANNYALLLDAYSVRGLPLYASETDFTLEPGMLNDLGEVRLLRAGAPTEGDLSFDWRFGGEQRCSRAGVSEVDVEVLSTNGSVLLRETAECVGLGLALLGLPPGESTIFLDAYDGRDNLLYTGDATGIVREGAIVDVGIIDLNAVP